MGVVISNGLGMDSASVVAMLFKNSGSITALLVLQGFRPPLSFKCRPKARSKERFEASNNVQQAKATAQTKKTESLRCTMFYCPKCAWEKKASKVTG